MRTIFVKIISVLTLIINTHAESYKECKNAAEGTFVAVENNCLAYIYCLDEESFTDSCPVGTYFDAEQQQCLLDEDGTKCTTFMIQPTQAALTQQLLTHTETTVTTTINTTTTSGSLSTSTLSPRPQCKPTMDEYFPYQQRCEYYYRCTRGYLSILRCSLGYGWDFLQEKCMPLKEAQCFKAVRTHVSNF
ncbi:probable chitinase 10 [Bactrocera neohumeralis]|uniref:probable chitinase 10 n=1 Tax=Bactrocera neohumeralis TaxID=98809 RepID=UPI0021660B85|nr:probable chitinase 10 [Bactrocera neohumeralis]